MEEKKTKSLLRSSNIIATTATTVLAVTALITVFITLSSWKVEREAARPYFTLKESPQVSIEKEMTLELKFNNVGIHPAVNLCSKSIVFNQNLKAPPIVHDQFDLVNEIPMDTSSSLVITVDKKFIDTKEKNIPPDYILVDLQYEDPIIAKKFNQTIYLRWNGVVEGDVQPIIHVRLAEKENILDYLQKQQIDLEERITEESA